MAITPIQNLSKTTRIDGSINTGNDIYSFLPTSIPQNLKSQIAISQITNPQPNINMNINRKIPGTLNTQLQSNQYNQNITQQSYVNSFSTQKTQQQLINQQQIVKPPVLQTNRGYNMNPNYMTQYRQPQIQPPNASTFNRSTEFIENNMNRVQPPMPMQDAQQRVIRARKQPINQNVQNYNNRTQPNINENTGSSMGSDVNDRINGVLQNTMGSISNPYIYGDRQNIPQPNEMQAPPIKRQRKQKQNNQKKYGTTPKQRRIRKQNNVIKNKQQSVNIQRMDAISPHQQQTDMYGGFGSFINPSGFNEIGNNEMTMGLLGQSENNLKPIKRKQKTNKKIKDIMHDFDVNDNVRSSMDATINKLLF